mmetsp:Transcript_9315/g.14087  ORF Transcript_9315/g.14087 Transcript_9315/m.14087 type:complete len:155 (-) Transcript_9315:541-1005(-)
MSHQQFYSEHLTKSLPVVFKGYATEWPIFKGIDSKKGNKAELDSHIKKLMSSKDEKLWLISDNVLYSRMEKPSQDEVFSQRNCNVKNITDENYEQFLISKKSLSKDKYLNYIREQHLEFYPKWYKDAFGPTGMKGNIRFPVIGKYLRKREMVLT